MYKTFDEYLVAMLNKLPRETEGKVLIVDNLTYLKQSNELTGEAVRLMKALKEMRTTYRLSILVLAHTPKLAVRSALNVNDLQGSKILSNFADNIFAIGGSSTDSDVRYLKHIKLRSTEMAYDGLNVPTFRLGKRGGNFLAFHFQKFDDERNLLDGQAGAYDHELMQKIRQAASTGMSQRATATALGISKTTVNWYMRLPLEEEKMRPISKRSIEAARQQMILEAARRRAQQLHAERLEEEAREVERDRRSGGSAQKQLAVGGRQLAGQPPPDAFDDDDDDTECDCHECLSGNPDKCLETNWSGQCCDGTDPNCCGSSSS